MAEKPPAAPVIVQLYDGDRLITEIQVAERPKSGGMVRAPLRQIDPVKAYVAVVVAPDGRTWRYRAQVKEVANHMAVLSLRPAKPRG